MKIYCKNYSPWKFQETNKHKIYFAGDKEILTSVIDMISGKREVESNALSALLRKTVGHYGLIIESEDLVLAITDPISSYPLFFTKTDDIAVSPDAVALKKNTKSGSINSEALQEFIMSGYTWGPETVYEGLFRLQAGEFFLYSREEGLRVHSYYRYKPEGNEDSDENDLISKLNTVLEDAIKRNIEQLNDAPVWIPLSGGLDSRILLCKFHEAGYKNLFAFSYGPPRNVEAEIAKNVADKLEVPWVFTPPPEKKDAREFFESGLRKDYWKFADNYSSIPTMQDLLPLLYLKDKGKLQKDAIIINGQTGDFVSGGHINKKFLDTEFDCDKLADYTVEKNFSIWKESYNKRFKAGIKDRLKKVFPALQKQIENPSEIAAIYDEMEWHGRQCRYVINGQKVYDFLGLNWKLPLWDLEFTDFWQSVPVNLKMGQFLWKKYLTQYDYKGLFSFERPKPKTFPVKFPWLFGKIVDGSSLLGFPSHKYSANYSQYGNYYHMYKTSDYFKILKHATTPPYARGVIALNIASWLKEKNIQCELTEEICPK